MLIVMKADATERDIAEVERVITELGLRPHSVPGPSRTAICVTGNQGPVDVTPFENLPGVAEAIRVTKPWKLISLDLKPNKSVVQVGDAAIGGDEMAIIAGPCAVESREQAFEIAEAVRRSGARFFRGGAFKPRTSPYAFQGLGEDGMKILADIREAFGLIIEIHNHPERALSDGAQALTLEQYEHLVNEVRAIHDVIAPAPVS